MANPQSSSTAALGFEAQLWQAADALRDNMDAAFARLHLGNTEPRTLAALRDTILPKLLSGELRVPTAEIMEVSP